MVEQDLISDKNQNVADVHHNFFINVVPNLNIPKYRDESVNIDHVEDPITRSIEQFKSHPSIVAKKVKTQINISHLIVFQSQKLRKKY